MSVQTNLNKQYMDKVIRHLKIWNQSYSKFGFSGIILIFRMLYLNKRHSKIISFNLKGLKNKLYLRTQTSDFMCFDDVLLNQSYNLDITDAEWIIDCGANIGLATIFFNLKFPEAKIVAIEMEEGNFSILEKNTLKNENVYLENAAVWSNALEHLVVEDGNKEWGYMVSTEEKGRASKHIKAITINDIVKKYSIQTIDILKIDIEGAEKEIFKKGVYEDWLKITKVLIIELHDRLNPGSSMQFFEAITKYNFRLEISGENLIFIRNV